jgi:16S rRNA (cytidine1402-2'-O)-methyltransferase
LWIVATPIGSVGDFAPRAREVLESAAMILAEDTRRARKLLRLAGIEASGRVHSYHEHNEDRRLPQVLRNLGGGSSVALMSDAGTPVLSDPGYTLVRAARDAGLPIATVPGPSSFTAALAASGQPPLPATLVGFLPARAGARRARIAELAAVSWTLVVFVSPHRLEAELSDLADGLGPERPATLMAEISKRHERASMGTLGEISCSEEVSRPRGEYVLVVGPARADTEQPLVDRQTVRKLYDAALAAGMARGEAMKAIAARLGIRRRQVFEFLVDHEMSEDR